MVAGETSTSKYQEYFRVWEICKGNGITRNTHPTVFHHLATFYPCKEHEDMTVLADVRFASLGKDFLEN